MKPCWLGYFNSHEAFRELWLPLLPLLPLPLNSYLYLSHQRNCKHHDGYKLHVHFTVMHSVDNTENHIPARICSTGFIVTH